MKTPPEPITAELRAIVRRWVLANRGVLTSIAMTVQPPVSQQFVHQVAYGEWEIRPEHPVRRELLARGWPGR